MKSGDVTSPAKTVQLHSTGSRGRLSPRIYMHLRGFAWAFGFQGFLWANVDFDLLGFRFRLFGQLDFQHSLVVVGVDAFWIHRLGRVKERVKLPYCRSTRR